ncbi:MAG: IPT/TIG domain-containing protein [Flavobacterium sp. JAD_PAG50586_2]|nr:MAG: IPT/TIG domain-containing protein [Flavobacterium sp. JAD_PAG50586_2]
MKQLIRFISSGLFFLLLSLSSCSTDSENSPVTVIDYPEQGLLGQPIVIQLNHIPPGNLQVFFDLEEAEISYLSETSIRVVVPRSITTHTPILKVIDLVTNETILDTTFSLKTPVITGYSVNQVTFNQVFSIYGDNFDELEDDIKIYVNNQLAEIVATNYHEVQLAIPYAISNSNLQIKVEAQRQEVNSTIGLQLKSPVISAVASPTAWITGQLIIAGSNFNPNEQFGQVLLNGVPCYFTASNTQLSITMPPGPFSNFQLSNVTYTTAGLTSNYNTNTPIGNDGIMVDHLDNTGFQHEIFVHNNKAYNLIYTGATPYSSGSDNVFIEFSPVTEKWTQLNSYHYTGVVADAVYDGNEYLYLYKHYPSTDTYSLSKLNMNTFVETSISLPYNKIRGPILFAYQSKLYLLSGLNNVNGVISTRTEKYEYSETTGNWTTLTSTDFSELPLVSTQGTGKSRCLHYNNTIYLNYGINFKTYKITPSLSMTTYNYNFSFGYQNEIIGKYGNGTSETLYNIVTNASAPMQNGIFDYGNQWFVLNNQIYFIRNSWTAYYQNTYYTQKLRTSIINGIL